MLDKDDEEIDLKQTFDDDDDVGLSHRRTTTSIWVSERVEVES